MKRPRILTAIAVSALALVATACLPNDPGPAGLYRGEQADIHPVVTATGQPITWGSAPNIDQHYGAILYADTPIQMADPRPALLANGNQPLRMWRADPNDGRTGRPAILWFHGGGFALGIDSMANLAQSNGKDYAQRGYVSFSVEYRTDTTLVGAGTPQSRPPALCQWVQDNRDPSNPLWVDRAAQCSRNVQAALADALGAVRYLRTHAAEYGIDPNKIAVAGFSAGAVIADDVAYQHEAVGTTAYFPGDLLSVEKSRVQAAIGASGCVPASQLGETSPIGTGDAPTSYIQSRYDPALDYACAAATVTEARSHGLTAELTSYCTENAHAQNLYNAHKDATDDQWTTFLARELGLYGNEPPPTAAPVCTN